jgi:hypothetical protein
VIRIRLPRYLRSGGRCRGKVRYGHLLTAQNACIAMAAKGSPDLSTYFCRRCKGYHVGHEPSLIVNLSKLDVGASQ